MAARKITLDEFLSAVKVRIEPLGKFLSEKEIESVCDQGDEIEPSLITEFKDGVAIDLPRMQAALLAELDAQLKVA